MAGENKNGSDVKFPSAFSLFEPSAKALLVNIWVLLGIILLPLAAVFAALPLFALGRSSWIFVALASLLAAVFFVGLLVLNAGVPALLLQSTQGKKVTLGWVFEMGKTYFWRLLGASLLIGLIVVGGFILFIVPGVFMIKRYYLVPYYIMDRDMKIMDAMRTCAADAKEFSGAVWGLLGVTVLIQLVGLVPFVGVVSTVLVILYYCAPALRYEQIKRISRSAKS